MRALLQICCLPLIYFCIVRYVNKNDEVVSDPCRIAIHYLRGWFFVDLMAAVPFDLMVTAHSQQEVICEMLFLVFYDDKILLV